MNRLPLEKRVQILSALCEGCSMWSTARTEAVSINTVSKLLEDAGKACVAFHDETVRNVRANRVQCDAIWSFVCAKQKNVATAKRKDAAYSDVWTWAAIDTDSKLIISWLVGARDSDFALALINDLLSRLAHRVQLTTDGHKAYLEAAKGAFGGDIDYAMLAKLYDPSSGKEKRYSPAECIGAHKSPIERRPDPDAERSNLSMRAFMRRFTKLALESSKKFENHCHMVALYTVWYNFAKVHKTLKMTPALATGVANRLWSMENIVALIDSRAAKPNRPAAYRKRGDEGQISN